MTLEKYRKVTRHSKRTPPARLHELECWECGESFMAAKPDARFCSQACQKRAWRARRGLADYSPEEKDILAILTERAPEARELITRLEITDQRAGKWAVQLAALAYVAGKDARPVAPAKGGILAQIRARAQQRPE